MAAALMARRPRRRLTRRLRPLLLGMRPGLLRLPLRLLRRLRLLPVMRLLRRLRLMRLRLRLLLLPIPGLCLLRPRTRLIRMLSPMRLPP
jgi:hypothetical protein